MRAILVDQKKYKWRRLHLFLSFFSLQLFECIQLTSKRPQWAGWIRTWSCRFLLGVKSTFYCPKGQSLQWTCCACESVICEDVSWHDWDNRLEHAKGHRYRECDQKLYEDLEEFMEHMKDFHSIKAGPHQKGFDNLPDGFQQLLAASCQR